MADNFITVSGYEVSYKWGAELAAHPDIITKGKQLDAQLTAADHQKINDAEAAWLAYIGPSSLAWEEIFTDINIHNDWARWKALPDGLRLLLYQYGYRPVVIEESTRYYVDVSKGEAGVAAEPILYGPLDAVYARYKTGLKGMWPWQAYLGQNPVDEANGEALWNAMSERQRQDFGTDETQWAAVLFGGHQQDVGWGQIVSEWNDWLQLNAGVRFLLYAAADKAGDRNSGPNTAKTVALTILPGLMSNYATGGTTNQATATGAADNAIYRGMFWTGADKIAQLFQSVAAVAPINNPSQTQPGAQAGQTQTQTGTGGTDGGGAGAGTGGLNLSDGSGSSPATPTTQSGSSGLLWVILGVGAVLLLGGRKK